MAVTDLSGLLRHELADLLYAERVFLKGLKDAARESTNPVIRDRIVRHAEESQEHITNLERAFESIGYRPRAQRSAAAIGLDEARATFRNEKRPTPDVMQAFDLGLSLRVELFEVAAYRAALALAREIGAEECARLLQKNLDEEASMASFLERAAGNALAGLGDA